MNSTRASPTLSRQWLVGMGEGAAKSNVTVQYCMTFARMVRPEYYTPVLHPSTAP